MDGRPSAGESAGGQAPVDRRRFLALAASGGFAGLTGLSGCLELNAPGAESTDPADATPVVTDAPLASQGYPTDICEESPVSSSIDAIDEPAFAADWADIDPQRPYAELDEEAVVIGLLPDRIADLADEPARGAARPRAYPVDVLWFHEIVNDVVGVPVIVTYCPLCRSGMVADRRLDGAATRFRVSGLLWRPPGLYETAAEEGDDAFAVDAGDPHPEEGLRGAGNLVMVDDATRTFWSQLLLRGICGSRRGETLPPVPSTATTWGAWRAEHPDTEVLLPPPHSGTAPEPVDLG